MPLNSQQFDPAITTIQHNYQQEAHFWLDYGVNKSQFRHRSQAWSYNQNDIGFNVWADCQLQKAPMSLFCNSNIKTERKVSGQQEKKRTKQKFPLDAGGKSAYSTLTVRWINDIPHAVTRWAIIQKFSLVQQIRIEKLLVHNPLIQSLDLVNKNQQLKKLAILQSYYPNCFLSV